MRALKLLLLAIVTTAAATAIAGCGSTGKQPVSAPTALKLQREDLVAASRALEQSAAPVAGEVAAAKAVWPLIAGPNAQAGAIASAAGASRAVKRATRLPIPALFGEARARSLTGPASQIAGVFRSSVLLSRRGWEMQIASSQQISSGSPAVARFARENVALYTESIYDAHFGLAQIGKKLRAGYEQLGGASAFGPSLTQAQVDSLTLAYSEARIRLYPHVRARLGS
jgi:hypothetical protein